jgi:putative ABC transport system permease protein
MMTLRIAWRNIFRQKRRTVLTMLTMLGGFALSAISIGWADGTYNRIIDMFTRNRLGHVQVHARGYLNKPSLYKNIKTYQTIGETIERIKEVESWAPRFYAAGLASVGDRSLGVRIIGIDPQKESAATRFENKVIQGKSFPKNPAHQVILGKGAARTLKANPGDQIVIVSQAADGSIANDLYTLVGIIESGDELQDQSCLYLHLKDAQELFWLEGAIHEIVVIARKLNQVKSLAREIRKVLNNPELEVDPWQEFARSFYVAMKADKQGAWIMLFVVILIVAIGVLNTVLMTVLERTREYGVLRAMGTRPIQVVRLVLYETALMACLSIIVGAALSLLVNYLLSHQGIPMPQPYTYGGIEFTHFYSEVNARSFYIPAVTVMVCAVLVSAFPAVKAARIEPTRAMRMQ